ncbi:hypothetical protein SAMN05444358_102138 [Ruegeria halocynthiae]|uniref:Uncharacterized protein n=1 Tax=Ruegeria halocynthiae TaxID=985054 RepID=A0A1H2Y3E2_9RHOB|nr:hypothetical protein SAMN05444358_102138 [Ruegeria halocynthiae]
MAGPEVYYIIIYIRTLLSIYFSYLIQVFIRLKSNLSHDEFFGLNSHSLTLIKERANN